MTSGLKGVTVVPRRVACRQRCRPRFDPLPVIWLAAFVAIFPAENLFGADAPSPGPAYTNVVIPAEPWSIHVVKIPRGGAYEFHSRHAGDGAIGMATLSAQIAGLNSETSVPVAAINGGFYRRDKTYAGAARGLQIVAGEVLSTPSGGPSLWVDVGGEAHITEVTSQFQITWPDGKITPFRLNDERADGEVTLYTPAIGASTRTTNGLEFVLERADGSRWLPLRMGRSLTAKVRATQSGGNSPLTPEVMVLSVGPKLMEKFRAVGTGAILQISTASSPGLSVARTALSGGPVLVHDGKRQKIRASLEDAYESSSMLERHPRTAIGWNGDWYFLVVVDGRQRDVSDGMTLDELSGFLVKLGCEEALNLDGGGSSTLWFGGSVRNSPCDGYERPIANSLVVVRKEKKAATRTAKGQAEPTEKGTQP